MSLRVEELKGNTNKDQRLRRIREEFSSKDKVDRVLLPRRDATKNRLRVRSERGRDVLIDVARGTLIRHGDVLQLDEGGMLVVEWLPEETMIIKFTQTMDWRQTADVAAKVGYILGIKHFPLFAAGGEILVPLEGKRDDLRKALAQFPDVEIRVEMRILDLQPELTGYEHTH